MRLRNKSCDAGANGNYSYHPKQADWRTKDELYVWLKYQRQSLAKEVNPEKLQCLHAYLLSHVRLFATLGTIVHQAPLSMGFSRQESWSGLPFPSLRDLPHPGIEPRSPALQADTLPLSPQGSSQRSRRVLANLTSDLSCL